jgi:transposase
MDMIQDEDIEELCLLKGINYFFILIYFYFILNRIYSLIYIGIDIVFLPAYSPELNPCELVFGFVKNRIRRSNIESLFDEVLLAFDAVKIEMINFYKKCIYPDVILPEMHIEI